MCHSPINALGGNSQSRAFEGGLIPMQNWYAPSLTSNKEAGLGEWSIEEIVALLRTGHLAIEVRSTDPWRKSPSTACNI